MLFYIRKSEWKRVMCDVEQSCLPKQVQASFEEQRMVKEKRHKEKIKAHLYVNIRLAAELHFTEQVIGESYNFDSPWFGNIKHYRVHKKTSFEDVKEMVNRDYGIPRHLQRFWGWSLKDNYHIQIHLPVDDEEYRLKAVLDLMVLPSFDTPPEFNKTAVKTINLFLESPQAGQPGTDGVLHMIQDDEIMVFVKYYDPVSMEISYLGHLFIRRACQMHQVFEKTKKMAGLAPEEEVLGFGEVEDSPAFLCRELEPAVTRKETHLSNGDIIIIQKVAANNQCKYPTVRGFLEFIQISAKVIFRPLKKPKDEGFKLDLSKTLSYEQVIAELAKQLQVDDPKKLRLTRHNLSFNQPGSDAIEYNGFESLEQMILDGGQYTNILYYEVLDIQLPYLKTSRCVKILLLNKKGELQSEHELRLPKDGKMYDLVEGLKLELGEEYSDCDMRIMQLHFTRIYIILDHEQSVEEMCSLISMYTAIVIPKDQKSLKSNEFLVLFYHCTLKDDDVEELRCSFLVKVKTGETVREVKVRVQQQLEISDEEFSNWRIAFRALEMHPVEYLRDEDEILAKFSDSMITERTNGKIVGDRNSFIALTHEDQA